MTEIITGVLQSCTLNTVYLSAAAYIITRNAYLSFTQYLGILFCRVTVGITSVVNLLAGSRFHEGVASRSAINTSSD